MGFGNELHQVTGTCGDKNWSPSATGTLSWRLDSIDSMLQSSHCDWDEFLIWNWMGQAIDDWKTSHVWLVCDYGHLWTRILSERARRGKDASSQDPFHRICASLFDVNTLDYIIYILNMLRIHHPWLESLSTNQYGGMAFRALNTAEVRRWEIFWDKSNRPLKHAQIAWEIDRNSWLQENFPGV